MTNDSALIHDKSFQIYLFYIKCQAQNDFQKESKVE